MAKRVAIIDDNDEEYASIPYADFQRIMSSIDDDLIREYIRRFYADGDEIVVGEEPEGIEAAWDLFGV